MPLALSTNPRQHSAAMISKTIRPAVGVILAGGLSRRMFAPTGADSTPSGDKGLLRLGAMTMIDRVIRRLRPQVAHLVLNANGDPARFASLSLPVVADPIDGFVGPLAGVLAGYRWATTNTPDATHLISVSSDAPFLPVDLVQRLAKDAQMHPTAIILARSRGEIHPVIGCWPICHADDLERELRAGVRKVLRWTDRHGTRGIDFEDQLRGGESVDPFFNANTPAEFAEAARILTLPGEKI
jgi:molybdenum cofactor guanylyltransferase